jgi:ABC-type multidrug transport system ATPase subunit
MTNTKAIIVKNISKSYGEIPAVENLTFEVKKGEFFGFLGPNGAGKTTTIRMLTGIIAPNSGDIILGEKDISDRASISKSIGVLSESRGFYEWMTGEEYLLFFASLYNVSDKKEKVQDLLAKVGLLERKDTPISTYSRGMKQRLGLARTLVNNPQIIFLDEPTLGLDPQGQEDIHNLLKKLNQEGVTIFFSSHVLSEVAQLCSTIAIINKGRLVAQGTLDELQKKTNSTDLREVFLNLTHE